MKEEIKAIILSYCEGIEHLEFSRGDLNEMITKIQTAVTNKVEQVKDELWSQ